MNDYNIGSFYLSSIILLLHIVPSDTSKCYAYYKHYSVRLRKFDTNIPSIRLERTSALYYNLQE
jgi:hypothetical protein